MNKLSRLQNNDLRLTRLSPQDVGEIVGWRYDPPYDTYNVPAEEAALMSDPAQRFFAVRNADELISYVCLGAEARVAGLGPVANTDDLGFGLRPDLMGRGLSRQVLPWLLQALADEVQGDLLRVVILDWNARSLAAYRRAGFQDVGRHTNQHGTYRLLTRPMENRQS